MSFLAAAVLVCLLASQSPTAPLPRRTCTIESTTITVFGHPIRTPTIGYPCP